MAPWGEDAPDTRVPEPSISFRVQVRDLDLNTFDVVKVSFDGHIYLTGRIGKAKVSVPFEKIDSVWFEESGTGVDVLAIVTLRGGEQQNLIVDGTTPCYGIAAYGNIQIELRHLRDAKFLGRAK